MQLGDGGANDATCVDAGIRKALNVSRSLSATKSYTALELLISRLSVETHTSLWLGKRSPNTREHSNDVSFAIVRGSRCNGHHLTEQEERTLQLLNTALRVLSKSTYISWILCFKDGEGPKMGDGGGPNVLLALVVCPFERLGRRNKRICLRLSNLSSKTGEARV